MAKLAVGRLVGRLTILQTLARLYCYNLWVFREIILKKLNQPLMSQTMINQPALLVNIILLLTASVQILRLIRVHLPDVTAALTALPLQRQYIRKFITTN